MDGLTAYGTEKQLTLFDEIKVKPKQEKTQGRSRDEVFEDYDGFAEKFKTKKTTDDCYTPEEVYKVILDFVGNLTSLDGRPIVRPFYPGGDFVNYEYPENCVVVDNPPFSILSKIVRFYSAHNVPFFLFGPSLTLFTAPDCDVTYIIADTDIVYENGAVVRTGFVTNLCPDIRIWCCPELKKAIAKAQETPSKQKRGFVYPDNIVTAATLGRIAAHQTELIIRKKDCQYIADSDSAKAQGRSLFGGGFILSDRAAAERAAAERAAAERAAAERKKASLLNLSPRERRLIEHLNKQSEQ